MIKITEKQRVEILSILSIFVPGHEVYAFGSRVNGTAREYSDLDVVIRGEEPLSLRTMALLREAFEDSYLPFRVDVSDWYDMDESFRKIIADSLELVQSSNRS